MIYSVTPTAVAAAGEGESLQETLTRLYQQANPSVVYIIVSIHVQRQWLCLQ